MKRLLLLVCMVFLTLVLAACGDIEAINDEDVTIRIPRELFFMGGLEEEFIDFFGEWGGIVAEFEEDRTTFWRNQPENAGTIYMEVVFVRSDLAKLGMEVSRIIQAAAKEIMESFDPISAFNIEVSCEATRFIFTADFDGMATMGDWLFIHLLDFTFPELSVLEYSRRVIFEYDMSELNEISFHFKNDQDLGLHKVYNFFLDAPRGLAVRHGVR